MKIYTSRCGVSKCICIERKEGIMRIIQYTHYNALQYTHTLQYTHLYLVHSNVYAYVRVHVQLNI